jgi:hypothetical protein
MPIAWKMKYSKKLHIIGTGNYFYVGVKKGEKLILWRKCGTEIT